jgi:hypothetical protein
MRKTIIKNRCRHRAKTREMQCVFRLRTLLCPLTIKRAKLSKMCSTWWTHSAAHFGMVMRMRVLKVIIAMGLKWNHCIYHSQLWKKAAIQGKWVLWIFKVLRKRWALFRKNGRLTDWFLLKFSLIANLSLKSLNPAKLGSLLSKKMLLLMLNTSISIFS